MRILLLALPSLTFLAFASSSKINTTPQQQEQPEDITNYQDRRLNVYTNIRWKDRVQDVVQIPYNVDSRYFTTRQKEFIEQSIQVLAEITQVIKFVQQTNQAAYINVVNKSGGCSSRVGKSPSGKEQEINLAPGCLSAGVIQHEFLHALGFAHEQNRPDREDYVDINWSNIIRKNWHNFYQASSSSVLGASYEYSSVMHYGRRDFAIDPTIDTITPKDPDAIIGQRQGATVQDLIEVRLLYQCLSGPRSGAEYLTDLCTSDCKCWKGAEGCDGNNDACQGNLVCVGNVCEEGEEEGTGTANVGVGGGGGGCTDIPGWTDSQGDGCDWYEQFDRGNACVEFGNDFGNTVTGKTAREACCFCGGGSIAGITFVELQNVEYPGYCMDLAAASTTNGNNIVLYECNGTPAQKWWVDSNNYFRSALDIEKCIVGSRGATSQGTNLIINDCLANDDRFVFQYYTDSTFSPKNNEKQCFGPSRSEGLVINSVVVPVIHLWDCSDSSHQKWLATQLTANSSSTEERRRKLAEQPEEEGVVDAANGSVEQQCQDVPLGWYDAYGDNCEWYAENNRCDTAGSTNKNFGKTANQACCVCGGGSLLLEIIQDDAVKEETIPNNNGCWDSPMDWTDSVGDGCMWYAQGNNCDYYGHQFASHSTATSSSEFGDGGITASQVCCACGGGATEPPLAQDDSIGGGDVLPGCSDSPSRWLDVDGDDCAWYAEEDHCANYGGNYTGTNNRTANEACCTCGGGYNPNGIVTNGTTTAASITGVLVSKSLSWLPGGLQFGP